MVRIDLVKEASVFGYANSPRNTTPARTKCPDYGSELGLEELVSHREDTEELIRFLGNRL